MPYTNQPSNRLAVPDEFVSDGTYARFVNVKGEWHISLAPELAAMVQVGTTVTCDVWTKAGKHYTRSGTVVRKQTLHDGTPRALATIAEFRAGRASDERNTFAMLPNGDWGVRLHASASRSARIGEVVEVAVTAKSGRVAHVKARVFDIVQNEHGDRQAVAATRDLVRAVAPDAPLLCVLNGVPPRGPRERQARELLADIDVPVCASGLGLRAAIDYAAAAGMSAREYEPRGKAAAEIATVYATIRRLVDLPTVSTANSPDSRKQDSPAGRSTDLSTTRQADSPATRHPDCAGNPSQCPIRLTCAGRSWTRPRAAIRSGVRRPRSRRHATLRPVPVARRRRAAQTQSLSSAAPCVDAAREIRDAYSGGSGAFYVSVGEDARQGVPWRQKMDDREYFEAWMASLKWWADPTKGPPER